jgi:hypothetical protein
MRQRTLLLLIPSLILLTLLTPAFAQWSGDPAKNLAIADLVNDQVQAKLATTADGGCYVSWFDNSSGGYDVYLQRLDANGNEQWAHNGVLVADRSFSSTQDYGLDVDSNGNALLVFRDDRGGSEQVTASLISPSGTLVWGSAGIQLSSGSAFFAAPKIAGTSDGGSVAGWISDSSTILQKLDADGSPQWGSGITLSDTTGGSFGLSEIKASDSVNVIVSWVRQGPNFFDPKHIWAQKFDETGTALWPASHVKVYDSGSVQFGYFPTFITDGSGGAVFRWYSVSPLQVFAQRILANGTEAFTHNGVAASTNAAQLRVSPDAAFNPATGDIYLSWQEMNSNQSQFGVYGQKIDSGGALQWTSTGAVIRPVGSTAMSQVSIEAYGNGAMVFFVEELGIGSDRLFATLLDKNGTAVWSPAIITASSTSSGKSRLETTLSTDGMALLAWQDDRAGDEDVFVQNVQGDGSLGRSCDLSLDGSAPTLIDFPEPFYVVAGSLADLWLTAGFSTAACVDYFTATPATDPLADPGSSAGRYYLARGVGHCQSYGDSSLVPDPRDDLDLTDPCP